MEVMMKRAAISVFLAILAIPVHSNAELVAETLKRYDGFALHIQLSDTTGSCAPRHRVLVTMVERFTAYAFADGCWDTSDGKYVVVNARTVEDQRKFTVSQPIGEFTNEEALRKFIRTSRR